MSENTQPGARIYSRLVLRLYDLYVVHFSNSVIWRCPRDRMLALYQQHLGRRHLDVGPGTGWYLRHAELPGDIELTLMDLNANSLSVASTRITGHPSQTLVADALQPLPAPIGPFDSIGTNFLFHCLPGSWPQTSRALDHLADRLTDDGVLFGSTILGKDVQHTPIGRLLLAAYNRSGIFDNRHDDAAGLAQVLSQHFTNVSVDVVNTVALFSARGPIRWSPRPVALRRDSVPK